MTFPSHIQTIDDLHGTAGQLEAILNTGLVDPPFTAVVAHPHPPSGGTMHTKVCYHAMKAFNAFGLPVLRFNFRGVGRSEGAYSDGPGEIEDVKAAVNWLDQKFGKPILFAGFSFGSNIGMRATVNDSRVPALIALGLPLLAEGRSYSYHFLQNCIKPRLFLSGDHDPFGPVAPVTQMIQALPEPKQITWIEGADHFFAGVPGSLQPKLDRMQLAMRQWISKTFPTLTEL